MKVNLGSGQAYMEGWVNVDASPNVRADVRLDALEFIERFGAEVEELYMGHFLEHLVREQAESLLRLALDRLPTGSVVSAVTPDMRAIFSAYLSGEIDNRLLNEAFVYSYVQPSHHVWCHDAGSLTQLFHDAGYLDVEPIDPSTWEPVFHKSGPESRWQCGVRAIVPKSRAGVKEATTVAAEPESESEPETLKPVEGAEVSAALVAKLLSRNQHLVREIDRGQQELSDTRESLKATEQELQRLHGMPGSKAFQAAIKTRRAVGNVLPRGTRRRELVERAVTGAVKHPAAKQPATGSSPPPVLPGAGEYRRWAERHQASGVQLREQRNLAARLGPAVTFLVTIQAHSGSAEDDAGAVRATLDSLAAQSWPHWRAAVVSTEPLQLGEANATPVTVVAEEAVAGALNTLVRDDEDAGFVLLLEAGDQLSPDALCEAALAARRDPSADLVYWDDDLLAADGTRHSPRLRPSWSPEMLLSQPYIDRSFAMRRSRYLFCGGLRGHLADAMTWDLLLLSDLDGRAVRVPRVLGHVVSRPTAISDNGVAAVEDALSRRGIPARAVRAGGRCELRWTSQAPAPSVSVIVPTRHNRQMLSRLLPSLRRTDYPDWELVIIDNGGESAENAAWYESMCSGIDLSLHWWDQPFNYSAVNNEAARRARGQVLIFLNDDTEIVDPEWMREMVGWAARPEIGAVGMTLLTGEGHVQHAGVVLGMSGFADHVFEGMQPEQDSIFGPVRSYRNSLAVTAACLAVERRRFEEVDGFDERFILCGSDVVLGLDLHRKGYRNLCSSSTGVRHFESLTRGTHVPYEDFFASFWRYQSWIFGGDPYYSPNLSLGSRTPRLKEDGEPTPGERIAEPLNRPFVVFRQGSDANEAYVLAGLCRATAHDREAVEALHRDNAAPFAPATVNWYIPELDSPFYGGINTALRIADHLARYQGVRNRFLVWGRGPEQYVRSALAATFPALSSAEIILHDGSARALLAIPPADVAIATLWVTAFQVAQYAEAKRKFYLIQDFEPGFYPAGTMYALAEESYRLGLYGICNTPNLLRVYQDEYQGTGMAFTPAVDRAVFHAEGRRDHTGDEPVTLFVYSRPGHWRNCWEMASLALREAKQRLGDRLRIVTAGSWAVSGDLEERAAMSHLGLLDYRATGELYRQCDIGMALTVSRHPSYLPLELMACGVPVIAFDNPWGHWLLEHEQDAYLAERTVDGLVDGIVRMVRDQVMRRSLAKNAVQRIDSLHSNWDGALSGIYAYMRDPATWSAD